MGDGAGGAARAMPCIPRGGVGVDGFLSANLQGASMHPASIFVLAQNDVSPVTPATPSAPAAPGAPGAPGANTASGSDAGTNQLTTSTGQPSQNGAGNATPPGSGMSQLIILAPLGLMIIWMFVSSSRNAKKEKQKREDLFAAMKKGDKIQTIGGIIGTVAEVRENEVIVKVDDSTRIKFVKSAIATILGEEASVEKK
jgi:preprotein translocase subunit YajC